MILAKPRWRCLPSRRFDKCCLVAVQFDVPLVEDVIHFQVPPSIRSMDAIRPPDITSHEPAGEPAPFWSEELELEADDGLTLGDNQTARVGHGVTDITIGKIQLDVVFTDIRYFPYQSQGACYIHLEFTIKSDAGFLLKAANLTCIVGNANTELEAQSTDIVRPMILMREPTVVDDDNPTSVSIEQTLSRMPELSVNGIFSFGGMGDVQRKAYTEEWGWHVHSSITSSNAKRRTTRDKVTWTFTANRMQQQASLHHINVKTLIRHDGKPFFADFTLAGSLSFGGKIRSIGRSRTITNRRHFAPVESDEDF